MNHKKVQLRSLLVIITLFAIAMGFLEAAVVVYMREILYPGGFEFPLSPVPVRLVVTELFREVATMVMLITIGIVAAKRFSTGFAWFIYSFAIWDIFYYVFLKAILDWPESLLTWDVLFLIPTTWTGPVLSPVLVSLTMILLAVVILVYAERGKETRIRGLEWAGLIAGSLILVFSWIVDYSKHMLIRFSLPEMLSNKDPEVLDWATRYIPGHFPWWIFIMGETIIIISFVIYRRRIKSLH
ncbi:MAG: hypothetical protein GY790_21195 [Bacteroidetes bacterium]|nr:hypothetical protein [Bacteroidota bacterium]